MIRQKDDFKLWLLSFKIVVHTIHRSFVHKNYKFVIVLGFIPSKWQDNLVKNMSSWGRLASVQAFEKWPVCIFQFNSVPQSCLSHCDPMNCSMPGLRVHHQLPEFTQTHVYWVKWCHPTILPSVIPFCSCPQSFPASGSLQMNQLFASGGQSIGVSASTSVLPMNTQD